MHRNSDNVLTEWLVLSAQGGKASAVNQLLKIWYPRFLRYSARQLNDGDAAKDVVQDTLVLIAKRIRRLKDPVAFPRWSYQILHRRGVDYQRSEIRRRAREAKTAQPDTPTREDTNPEFEVDTKQTVRDALAELDSDGYTVVHLYYLHDLSLREIATICSIPVGTVKSRLYTARGKLKKLLEEKL